LAGARSFAGDRKVTVSEDGARALRVRISGTWLVRDGISLDDDLRPWLSGRAVSRVSFDARAVARWDSALVTFVADVAERLEGMGVTTDFAGLPDGAQRLLALTGKRPERRGHAPAADRPSRFVRVGEAALDRARRAWSDVALVGDVTSSVARLATGRARTRAVDVVAEMFEAGARALPIVTLTSALLGAIMAFVGAVSLRPFGAGIYVANVVAIAMLRELGAVMTAIVMAGRTGSAYAASIATMKLTQELDALETMGVGAIDFLILPRMLALSLMQPLLCVYADFVSIAGGGVVAASMLEISPALYLNQTRAAATLTTFFIGVAKSAVFGTVVAFLGCRAGVRTGRSAAGVGRAATTAMVDAIVVIIAVDGAFAVIFQVLGI
jgi:phospholipid/cholesterol/gamma-HCH transport system permease protein